MIKNTSAMVNAEANLASILSIFDSEYVLDIIDVVLDKNYNTSNRDSITNAIYVVENKYILARQEYAEDAEILERLESNRYELYIEVIEYICSKFEINVDLNMIDRTNVYYIAYYIYDLLVNYYNNITKFLVMFIIRNKNQIYDELNLVEFKKNKDSSTIYNKKMYKNNKMAIIISNIEFVIQNIVTRIPFDVYVNTIYAEANGIGPTLTNILRPIDPMYVRNMVHEIFKTVNTTQILLSDIRYNLSNNVMADMLNDVSIHDYIETEEDK